MLGHVKQEMEKKLKGNILDYRVKWDKEKGKSEFISSCLIVDVATGSELI